ncbi:MAG: ABC transporter ATP-binding protein [Burkholderiaceae bacterium]
MPDRTLLSVENVTMQFGGLVAVSNLSFTMREGQIKGLIGPNGAGKSTLFNVIAGVLPPTDGRVRFNGNYIENLPSHTRIGAGMSRTFQNLQIFKDLTVVENVMVGCHSRFSSGILAAVMKTPGQRREEEEIRTIAMEKLDQLDMAHKAHLKASALSFGEAKILEIARSLATNPGLLLLDEPVAGVPHAEVSRVAQVIREVNRAGTSILLVEHNMRFVMGLCDEIVVLNYGCKIAEGTGEQISRDPKVLEAYLGTEESADA